jgi:hypothetical protein
MKKLFLLATLLASSPAFAAVECNSVPSEGGYRIRFSTERSDYGVTKLHQDWIEKKNGKVNRRTNTVLSISTGNAKLAIRTVPTLDETYKHLRYIEINGTPAGAIFNARVKWWSFRSTEDKAIPHWVNDGLSDLTCIVD